MSVFSPKEDDNHTIHLRPIPSQRGEAPRGNDTVMTRLRQYVEATLGLRGTLMHMDDNLTGGVDAGRVSDGSSSEDTVRENTMPRKRRYVLLNFNTHASAKTALDKLDGVDWNVIMPEVVREPGMMSIEATWANRGVDQRFREERAYDVSTSSTSSSSTAPSQPSAVPSSPPPQPSSPPSLLPPSTATHPPRKSPPPEQTNGSSKPAKQQRTESGASTPEQPQPSPVQSAKKHAERVRTLPAGFKKLRRSPVDGNAPLPPVNYIRIVVQRYVEEEGEYKDLVLLLTAEEFAKSLMPLVDACIVTPEF